MAEPTATAAASIGLTATGLTVFGVATGLRPELLLAGVTGALWALSYADPMPVWRRLAITVITALVAGYLAPILKRDTDYQQFGDWLAAVVNLDFDRIWLAVQTLQQNNIRSLKLPVDTATDQTITENATDRAGKVVSFDPSGNMTLTVPVDLSLSIVSPFMESLLDDLDQSEARITLGTGDAFKTDIQGQVVDAFTSSGTAPAYTVTSSPAYGAYAANQRMRVAFHAAGTTGSNTLNRDGLGAKTLMQYDASGAKTPAIITANLLADVEYDGTDMVVLDRLPVASVPVRQTVLNGPVDSGGFPSFLPATSGSLSITSQNITGSAPLVVAAANGFSGIGAVNRVGQSIANLTWSGLAASSTNYLYVDISVGGVLTAGSTTLAPTYQFGGTRSTTNGQATFNIQEMSMTVGNGSTAPQAWRVFVGEAVTNGSTVTSSVAYAYQGRYLSAKTALPAAQTPQNYNHNIGVAGQHLSFSLTAECTSAVAGFTTGEQAASLFTAANASGAYGQDAVSVVTRNAVAIVSDAQGFNVKHKATGAATTVGTANFSVYVAAHRRW